MIALKKNCSLHLLCISSYHHYLIITRKKALCQSVKYSDLLSNATTLLICIHRFKVHKEFLSFISIVNWQLSKYAVGTLHVLQAWKESCVGACYTALARYAHERPSYMLSNICDKDSEKMLKSTKNKATWSRPLQMLSPASPTVSTSVSLRVQPFLPAYMVILLSVIFSLTLFPSPLAAVVPLFHVCPSRHWAVKSESVKWLNGALLVINVPLCTSVSRNTKTSISCLGLIDIRGSSTLKQTHLVNVSCVCHFQVNWHLVSMFV